MCVYICVCNIYTMCIYYMCLYIYNVCIKCLQAHRMSDLSKEILELTSGTNVEFLNAEHGHTLNI